MIYRLENYYYYSYYHYIKFQELYSMGKVMDTLTNQKVILTSCKMIIFNAINYIFYWIMKNTHIKCLGNKIVGSFSIWICNII